MIKHLLVTNDFPPKVGGIQNYLWELWRRLPPSDFVVLTSPYDGTEAFDRSQPYRIVRTREPVLLPSPMMVRRIRSLAAQVGAALVVLDPAVPLGLVGPHLGLPYALALHGAEVTVPGRLPLGKQAMARVLGGASLIVGGGGYPIGEARRAQPRLPPVVEIPPGVDSSRFRPFPPEDRAQARRSFGISEDRRLVLSVSRLVPRKGMDVLIEAASRLGSTGDYPDLQVAVAGVGRDRARLERLIRRTGSPTRLLGRVADSDLPSLYGAADVFVLCCRTRWGGLEQEGFGIVLLEAAAAGLACVAGNSGGASEAVSDSRTGFVVSDPRDPGQLVGHLRRLLDEPGLAAAMGAAGRTRAKTEFSYDMLAARLRRALDVAGLGA
ncbi:MAG: glycosyltransferase family 4 protein [Acidimicrobiales bacterium]